MINFAKHLFLLFSKDKVEFFIFASCAIIIGANLIIHLSDYQISTTPYLEASLEISPKIVKVTKETSDFNNIQRADLIFKFKNNTRNPLQGVRVIIPPVGIGTLEWPNFLRQKPSSWPWNDTIFSLTENIRPEETKIATISAYVEKEGVYTISATVETKSGLKVQISPVTLTGE